MANGQRCYDCGKVNCECSTKASSRTYKKVNHILSQKIGIPCPNTGYPSQDFDEIVSLLDLRLK